MNRTRNRRKIMGFNVQWKCIMDSCFKANLRTFNLMRFQAQYDLIICKSKATGIHPYLVRAVA